MEGDMMSHKNFLKPLLFVIPVVILSSCPAKIGDLVDSTRKSLGNEATAYQRFSDEHGLRGEMPATQLVKWSAALSQVAESLDDVIDYFIANPEDRSKASSKLDALQAKVDIILDRQVALSIQVPSWQIEKANETIDDIYNHLQDIKSHYEDLFELQVKTLSYSLGARVDLDIMDARPECIEKFHAATIGDSERPTCLHAAHADCTHMMDLACVDTLIMAGSLERIHGSMCAEIWFTEIVNPNTGEVRKIKNRRDRTWLQGITHCQTDTVAYY
jgi:hypothetical protein